ncbi:MAG: HAMP domain-containing protein [Treponema sp.]|nr:HAMP domain-containing protein [Treponema sp.]
MNRISVPKISLRVKLLVLFLSVVLVANITLGLIAYRLASKGMTTNVYNQLTTASKYLTTQVSDSNEKQFNALHFLAEQDFMKDESISLKEKNSQLAGIASEIKGNLENVAFYDEQGNSVTSDGRTINFASRPYFQQAFAGKDYVSDPTFSTVTNSVLQHYSVPVHNKNGKPIGAVVMIVSGNAIYETIKDIDLGGGMHPSVINYKTRTTIANANPNTDENANKESLDETTGLGLVLTNIFNGKEGIEDFFDNNIKQNLIAAYKKVPNTDWTVFAVAPHSFYFSTLSAMKNSMFIVTIGIIVISSLMIMILLTMLIKPLKTVKESITSIASGNADLTKRIEVTSQDEIGNVVKGFNLFTEKLQTIIGDIKASKNELNNAGIEMSNSSQDTASSITQIISNIESMHGQIRNQVNSVSQTATAVNEIASNIESLKRMIESQSAGVTQASAAVEEMIGNIESVNQSVDKMAVSFSQLEQDAQGGIAKQQSVDDQIKKIEQQSAMLQEANAAISNIAEQTNLLAMNAAIEAAHAGEAGKGFAVVADEIRKLSETSSQQSKTIGDQLNNIQASIKTVVDVSSDSSKAFSDVSNQITQTDQIVMLIKAAMEEQKTGSRQIITALHNMNDSTVEVRDAASEMNEGNKSILLEIGRLQDFTSTMKSGMDEMAIGAEKINETGSVLQSIANQVQDSIKKIGNQIDQFKV